MSSYIYIAIFDSDALSKHFIKLGYFLHQQTSNNPCCSLLCNRWLLWTTKGKCHSAAPDAIPIGMFLYLIPAFLSIAFSLSFIPEYSFSTQSPLINSMYEELTLGLTNSYVLIMKVHYSTWSWVSMLEHFLCMSWGKETKVLTMNMKAYS